MKALAQQIEMQWKVNTPGLLKEIMSNDQASIFKVPLQIFGMLLHDVAVRASQLNDRELNKLMLQLALFEVADPYSPLYDRKVLKEYGL